MYRTIAEMIKLIQSSNKKVYLKSFMKLIFSYVSKQFVHFYFVFWWLQSCIDVLEPSTANPEVKRADSLLKVIFYIFMASSSRGQILFRRMQRLQPCHHDCSSKLQKCLRFLCSCEQAFLYLCSRCGHICQNCQKPSTCHQVRRLQSRLALCGVLACAGNHHARHPTISLSSQMMLMPVQGWH